MTQPTESGSDRFAHTPPGKGRLSIQFNGLPLMMLPGIAALAWVVAGPDAAENAAALWLAIVASSSIVTCLPHLRRLAGWRRPGPRAPDTPRDPD